MLNNLFLYVKFYYPNLYHQSYGGCIDDIHSHQVANQLMKVSETKGKESGIGGSTESLCCCCFSSMVFFDLCTKCMVTKSFCPQNRAYT